MTIHSPLLEILCAALGLVTGSVIGFICPRLVAYRLPEPPPFPPALLLIPLAGVKLTGWRPVRSLITQGGTAALFAGLAWHFGSSPALFLSMMYSALLVTIAYIDLDHRLVLNRLSYPGVGVALAGSLVWPHMGLITAFEGAAAGLMIFVLFQIVGRGALGTGDTKLALLIGAMRGVPDVFNALLLGVFLGGVGAALALFVFHRSRKDYIPYAPYLALGAVVSFFLTHG